MKSGRILDMTCSPSHLSMGRRERAAQFGLNDENEESFECNQSFPRALQQPSKLKPACDLSPTDLNKLKTFELNSISFLKKNLIGNFNSSLTGNKKFNNKNIILNDTLSNSYYATNNSFMEKTFDKSWAFYNQFVNSNALVAGSNEAQDTTYASQLVATSNPNKALIVINGRTTEILTANNISCDLFGYNENKLIGMKLKDLLDLASSNNEHSPTLIECDRLDEEGRIVLCSGKIFDAITIDPSSNEENAGETSQPKKIIIPVSMYMQKITTDESEPKCLCVMEPVQRVIGSFTINLKGKIKHYNSNFSYIFGYTNAYTPTPANQTNSQIISNQPSNLSTLSASRLLIGKDISELIPSIKLPIGAILPDLRKQSLTGRSCLGENIPLTVNILNKQLMNHEEICYNCTINIYINISGLITIRPNDYQIHSYNSTFARLLLGYNEHELLNKPISYLIPNFFDPSTTSVSNCMSASRPLNTPLISNSSYLNIDNYNKNRISTNGSFLENRQHIMVTPSKTKPNNHNNVNSNNKNVPSFLISNPDLKCVNCESQLKKQRLVKKNRDTNIVNEFNIINSIDYSPNQKCANYIENMNYSPTRSGEGSSTTPSTPQSSVKKSLLAKAIANNAATASPSSMSLDESINSNSTSFSSLSNQSITTFSNLEVSEFELNDDIEDMVNEEDIDYDVDMDSELNHLCLNCRSSKSSKLNKMNTSEVSLFTIENEINEDIPEEDVVEDSVSVPPKNYNSNSAVSTSTTIKRKASFSSSNQQPDQIPLNDSTSQIVTIMNKKFKNQVTSTPSALNNNLNTSNLKPIKINTTIHSASKLSKASTPSPTEYNINDGIYFGRARHADGTNIKIIYQRKLLNLKTNDETCKNLICVWISRDPYSDKSIMDCSIDQSQLNRTNRLNTTNNNNNNNDMTNTYSIEYEDLRTLGRGASGFVQLSLRKSDKSEVVTKYILKSKIYKENWINDERYGQIPLEVSILCKLDHPNIIKVLEVFQDSEHIQMVMEKHGCGMDLFEFIDRQRKPIEEPLASYIFKQIISAVSYLHSNNLVHRDIKDENIVINEKFQVKVIDFGSAAYFTSGQKFATFCGTIDYCSPDVLLGNKYHGPELDAWTCGIALYTLVFSENPFLDAEETIECILKPPFKVSKDLMKLLFSILCSKPEIRATIPEIEANAWVNQPVDINNFKWEDVVRTTEFHGNNAGEYGQIQDFNSNFKSNIPNPPIIKDQENNDQNNENQILSDTNNINEIKNLEINDLQQQKLIINTALLSKSF